MDAIYVLYMHTRASDGGIFYIGIGNIKRPFKKRSRTKFWKHIVNKHGYNVQLLAENLTWENACDLEKKYIAFYGRRDKNQGCLVNLTDGGNGSCGIVVSEERRKKIAEVRKGRKHSEETRKKISEATKGRKLPEEIRKVPITIFLENMVIDAVGGQAKVKAAFLDFISSAQENQKKTSMEIISNEAKVAKVKELGIGRHYDNNPDVVDALRQIGVLFNS